MIMLLALLLAFGMLLVSPVLATDDDGRDISGYGEPTDPEDILPFLDDLGGTGGGDGDGTGDEGNLALWADFQDACSDEMDDLWNRFVAWAASVGIEMEGAARR
ncbi:MAG: hypothetical protein QF819_05525 [Gemmatimonadota bacterium]|nr:hypothetical protein [Gemmatimonadota bacterium]MDP6802622.1 hypothetical protein [Gemmatimonadota bacterium]MDP7030747.1 hypothetical protein [Gemmatimonadota bacterium]